MVPSMPQLLNGAMPRSASYRKTFIRPWRKHRKLTLEQLADKAQTTASHLSMLERGQRGYTQEMLEAIAKALGTDVASLLGRDPGEPESIWAVWTEAKPSQRKMIIDLAKTVVKTGT